MPNHTTPQTDPDGQALMKVLTDLGVPSEDAYNAVQCVRNMAGENVIARLEAKIDAMGAALRTEMEVLNAKMTAGFAAVEAKFTAIDARIAALSTQIDTLESQLEQIQWMLGLLVAVVGTLAAVGCLTWFTDLRQRRRVARDLAQTASSAS